MRCPGYYKRKFSYTSSYTSQLFGTTLVWICSHGYHFNNQSSYGTFCDASGNWTGTDLDCEIISCGSTPRIANARSNIVSGVYKDSVLYRCIKGYWLTRNIYSVQMMCPLSGVWETVDYNQTMECTRKCYKINIHE